MQVKINQSMALLILAFLGATCTRNVKPGLYPISAFPGDDESSAHLVGKRVLNTASTLWLSPANPGTTIVYVDNRDEQHVLWWNGEGNKALGSIHELAKSSLPPGKSPGGYSVSAIEFHKLVTEAKIENPYLGTAQGELKTNRVTGFKLSNAKDFIAPRGTPWSRTDKICQTEGENPVKYTGAVAPYLPSKINYVAKIIRADSEFTLSQDMTVAANVANESLEKYIKANPQLKISDRQGRDVTIQSTGVWSIVDIAEMDLEAVCAPLKNKICQYCAQ